ncbi:ArnT family glycosyltransferase [Streptomyces iconiensis]|uniref:Glycosyltransferase family 39 protein n=1 Tax=Streptomyces iconiensis TaxID=1384038 RepID=A0ABT6ZX15_9ACTN|nr:glycosyltransferase family 39 protein [Streptomyces iconiensis]MDJ1133605.1 glycosyltransferase family 39 protein [Streptomyces iconiensis]
MPQSSSECYVPGTKGVRVPPQCERGGGRAPGLWLRLLPTLAVLAVLTRVPSFARTLWNPDEGFLATQSRQLADGGVLYDTVVDRKPPLVPWLYQGAFAVFGDGSLWPVRVLAVLAVLVGAGLIASIALRRWGVRAAWTASVGYVLLSVGLNPEDTQAATFEVFMLPWTVAAIWCAERARWLGAGLAVAGAVLAKQTGGAVLLPALFLLWQSRAGWPAVLRLGAGAVLPVGFCAFLFGPWKFVYWVATGSGSYLSADGAGFRPLLRALGGLGLLTLAFLPLLVALCAVVFSAHRRLREAADLWVWLAASLAATVVGFQFFGHYFLQLVPALALLGAAALHELRPRVATLAVALTALLASGFVGWGLAAQRGELDHAHRVADTIRAYTDPRDPVLLWGMHPEGYWLAGRSPASRYLTAGFLTNFSGGRGEARVGERYGMDGAWPYFVRELSRRPPELIVDDSRDKKYGVERMPTLRAQIERRYEKVATIDGTDFYVLATGSRAR